jgi:C1A family cysteine protease
MLTVVSVGANAFSKVATVPAGTNEGKTRISPLNPEFVKYQQDLAAGKVPGKTRGGHALGHEPSTVELPVSGGKMLPAHAAGRAATLPSTYDLRTMGRVTPVKDQNPCGTCWIFATYGSLESYLLTAETRNFSENNMKNLLSSNYTDGFDRGMCYPNAGGNYYYSTAYLARWSGPINGRDDPYNPNSGVSPLGLPVQKHVQNVEYIPYDDDYANIKQAIMDHGAVFSAFYVDDTDWLYYDPLNYTYYYNGDGNKSTNHDITIVGWNDSFDKDLFGGAVKPDFNGAFICKNSWGPSWGENGYFYISYQDYWIGFKNALFTAEPTNNYDHIYQYDPLGWLDSIGSGNTTTWWGANVFTATTNEQLAAVSFYAQRADTQYTVYVHVDPTSEPVGGTTYTGPTGTMAYPGYYTLPLTIPTPLSAGHKFSVIVKFTTPDFNYPVPAEKAIANKSSHATARPGQSYASSDGTSWEDTTSIDATMNVCIKAFTKAAVG